MNATLNSPGPLKERDPGKLRITRRQIALALILAILGAVAAIYTVDAVKSSDVTFPAQVATSKVYDLNFTNNGTVTGLLVKVGQRVVAGQPLATQDTTTLQSQLAADQAAVQADQQVQAQAATPQLTPAQSEQNALQVAQAQTALTNAKAGLASASSTAAANNASAQETITTAQNLATTDTARYQAACPSGPQPPTPGLTGAELQSATAAYNQCLNLQQTMDRDLAALAQDKAQQSVTAAQGGQAVDAAQAAVNAAQAALNLAQYQPTLQVSPANAVTQAQASASLSQAQSQLAQVQQQLKDATLVAPDSGIVAEVYGAVGEYLGPEGVHQYQAPAALPSSSLPPSFQLFPTQSVPQSNSLPGNEPTIEIIGGDQQVLAQVPENEVGSLPVGHKAHVVISALGAKATGTVTSVVLNPTRASTVTYDVYVTLSRTIPGLLPGMSATVSR